MNLSEVSAEQLGEMPIHAVSESFGTEGLVQRFGLEIASFDIDTQTFLNQALSVNLIAHRDQMRSRGPYVDHPLRTAIRVMHHYEVRDPDVIAGTLMHDVPEDQAEKIVDVSNIPDPDAQKAAAIEVLSGWFNPQVGQFLTLVTNPEFDPNLDPLQQYLTKIQFILQVPDPRAGIIKLGDFVDNGVGILWGEGPKMKWWATKYLAATPLFEEFIERPDLPFSPEVRQNLRIQLGLARVRFEAILAEQ